MSYGSSSLFLPVECSLASRTGFAQTGPLCLEKSRGSLTSSKPSLSLDRQIRCAGRYSSIAS
eukprot:2983505-Pyramimonas_sp.AAC.1